MFARLPNVYDLIIYDARRTAALLKRLNQELAGAPVESAELPTGELLVLMHGRETLGQQPYVVYLLGASELLPVVELERTWEQHRGPLLIPQVAQQLMRNQGGMHMKTGDRATFKRTVKQLVN